MGVHLRYPMRAAVRAPSVRHAVAAGEVLQIRVCAVSSDGTDGGNSTATTGGTGGNGGVPDGLGGGGGVKGGGGVGGAGGAGGGAGMNGVPNGGGGGDGNDVNGASSSGLGNVSRDSAGRSNQSGSGVARSVRTACHGALARHAGGRCSITPRSVLGAAIARIQSRSRFSRRSLRPRRGFERARDRPADGGRRGSG